MTSSNWHFDTEKSLVESHGLKLDEFEKIVEGLGREPNLTELGIFSACLLYTSDAADEE